MDMNRESVAGYICMFMMSVYALIRRLRTSVTARKVRFALLASSMTVRQVHARHAALELVGEIVGAQFALVGLLEAAAHQSGEAAAGTGDRAVPDAAAASLVSPRA